MNLFGNDLPASTPESRPLQEAICEVGAAALTQAHDPLWAAWQCCWRFDPDALALIDGGQRWTRAALEAWSQRIAAALRQRGVEPGAIIVIHGQRGAAALAAQLATLHCGATYLPLEPDLPTARLEFILQRTQIDAWLECTPTAPPLQAVNLPVVSVTALCDANSAPEAISSVPAAALQALYLLYTSGSSGQPKGVLGTRLGLWQRLLWQWQKIPYGVGERVAWRTPLGFVDAVAESWGALLAGVPLVTIHTVQVLDLDQFVQLVARYKISRLVLVPSLLDALLRAAPKLAQRWPQMRLIVCSGERWHADLARMAQQALPNCRWLNLYGMTEAAADATAYVLTTDVPTTLPIGTPLTTVRVALLSDGVEITTAGPQQPAEIALGGPGLALGYYRQAALTAAQFIPDPNPKYPGQRLYCTGDLGYLDDVGQFHYRGRNDQQVQLRGQRIELGEIEQAALQHPAVAQCVALAMPPASNAEILILSLALAPQAELTAQALRDFLQARLPNYMLPTLIDIRHNLPLLSNGKIDRQALAAARLEHVDGEALPQSGLEQQLALIWQEVLRCDPPARTSRFLQLGGNSLHAALVVSRIRAQWGVALSMTQFFQCETLLDQAEQLEMLLAQHVESSATFEVVEF